VRRWACLVALCGPLLAGCGTATRLGFSPHSRPASPVDVSVYLGARGLQLDPRRVSAGPVEFLVINASGRAERFSVLRPGGRPLARALSIPRGGTAQVKATLTGPRVAVGATSEAPRQRVIMVRTMPIGAHARTGDGELLQP
jgi:hypothetical protein